MKKVKTNMKMLVIGHEVGVAKNIYEQFDCEGIDISTGHDISDEIERSAVLGYVDDFDVIVIADFKGIGQAELIIDLFKIYQEEKKTIIVLNSCSQDSFRNSNEQYGERQMYKSAVDYACDNLSRKGKPCKLINLRLGYIEGIGPERNKKPMSPDSIPEVVTSLLMFPDDVVPSSITLLANQD